MKLVLSVWLPAVSAQLKSQKIKTLSGRNQEEAGPFALEVKTDSIPHPVYFNKTQSHFYANAKSDAVQEAALDLHSSSTIPSPIKEGRRSQEAGKLGDRPY